MVASSTGINKLQVIHNAALRTATGCTQETIIQHLHGKTLILPIHGHLQLHASQYKQKTTSITSLTQTYNILQHSKLKKNNIFNNGRYTRNIPTDPYTRNIPTDPYTITSIDIKTNIRHIHTSIVSRHLVTKGNNKILCTSLPYISSSEEIFPRLTRRTLAQHRTNKSPFLKSYLHKDDAKSHASPLFPLCNTQTHDTHHLFNYTHISTTL